MCCYIILNSVNNLLLNGIFFFITFMFRKIKYICLRNLGADFGNKNIMFLPWVKKINGHSHRKKHMQFNMIGVVYCWSTLAFVEVVFTPHHVGSVSALFWTKVFAASYVNLELIWSEILAASLVILSLLSHVTAQHCFNNETHDSDIAQQWVSLGHTTSPRFGTNSGYLGSYFFLTVGSKWMFYKYHTYFSTPCILWKEKRSSMALNGTKRTGSNTSISYTSKCFNIYSIGCVLHVDWRRWWWWWLLIVPEGNCLFPQIVSEVMEK